ncbi:MAG TPA: hypothetical protein VFM45_12160, partial [Anaeromyxobacteraceae bacterium]|nr:hypothetical protein [Anaeromyxobacteraceae bacterium]
MGDRIDKKFGAKTREVADPARVAHALRQITLSAQVRRAPRAPVAHTPSARPDRARQEGATHVTNAPMRRVIVQIDEERCDGCGEC